MIIPLEKDGSIAMKNYPFLGERYTFRDRLKGKGLGSVKIHYKKGIAEFDKLDQLNVDTAFVNFEPTTMGLLIRFNKSNRIRAFGLALSAIHLIQIEKIHFYLKNIFTRKVKRKTKGKLSIKGDFDSIVLEIPVNEVNKIIDFFKQLGLGEKLSIIDAE